MRGHNLFACVGSLEPQRQIKLKVPRFAFLNCFSSGLGSPNLNQLQIRNYELRVNYFRLKVKTAF
jgi:hypothetical protein